MSILDEAESEGEQVSADTGTDEGEALSTREEGESEDEQVSVDKG